MPIPPAVIALGVKGAEKLGKMLWRKNKKRRVKKKARKKARKDAENETDTLSDPTDSV